MAIGRYRDRPAEMDDTECRVAAAQYPEGGLVVGMGLGIVLGMALSPVAVALGPILGALAGYGAGRVFRGYRLRRLGGSAGEEDGRDRDPGEHHGSTE
jgi:hypothetical protein